MLPSIIIAAGLLGLDLDPLMYPGSQVIQGGSAAPSDGVPSRGIVAKHQVATSNDDYAKVVGFYDKKFDGKKFGAAQAGGTMAKSGDGTAESLSVLGAGPGRPFEMRVYVTYEPKASTTVIVTRAEGEKMTYIHLVKNSHTMFP